MGVSVFGWWFIGIGAVLLIGCGFLAVLAETRITKIEKLYGTRTGKRAPNWMHRVMMWALLLMIAGLVILAIAFACLFHPGPLCVGLYH